MDETFFSSLFDLTFDQYITPRIMSIIYVIGLLLTGVFTISYAFGGFTRSTLAGVFTLVSSPVVFLLGAIGMRVYCEVLIALVKIAQNTQSLKDA